MKEVRKKVKHRLWTDSATVDILSLREVGLDWGNGHPSCRGVAVLNCSPYLTTGTRASLTVRNALLFQGKSALLLLPESVQILEPTQCSIATLRQLTLCLQPKVWVRQILMLGLLEPQASSSLASTQCAQICHPLQTSMQLLWLIQVRDEIRNTQKSISWLASSKDLKPLTFISLQTYPFASLHFLLRRDSEDATSF